MIAVRIISAILGGIVPLIMLSGFLSPTESSPFGAVSSFIPFQSILSSNATVSPYAQYLPLLAGGGGALGLWYIVSQATGGIGSSISAASMTRMGSPGMAGFSSMGDLEKRMKSALDSMTGTGSLSPEKPLPSDINKVQFKILSSYYDGSKKPKEVAERLSMDKTEVEKETAALISNGYITKKNRLTSKGLELLS
ncbi:MAG: hypothetical protein ACREBU_15635 [Nitrososphaera sp.]